MNIMKLMCLKAADSVRRLCSVAIIKKKLRNTSEKQEAKYSYYFLFFLQNALASDQLGATILNYFKLKSKPTKQTHTLTFVALLTAIPKFT